MLTVAPLTGIERYPLRLCPNNIPTSVQQSSSLVQSYDVLPACVLCHGRVNAAACIKLNSPYSRRYLNKSARHKKHVRMNSIRVCSAFYAGNNNFIHLKT